MNSEPIDSYALKQAQFRSEKIRIIAIMAALGALAVFVAIRLVLIRAGTAPGDWLILASLFAAAIGYEGIMLQRLKLAVRSGKNLEYKTSVLNVFVETLFPTIALLVYIIRDYSGPYLTLVSPTVLIYFIIIILSTLRLEPLLALLTGMFAAACYLGVAGYVLLYVPKPDSTPASLPIEYYLTYTFIILLAGVIAALVSDQIRKHVAAAIVEAHEVERLKSDLETARSIQQGLLPRDSPSIPGFEIAAWNKPADQTGGDYYSWQELAEERLALTLADVTGHGIGAALVAAACHAYSKASFEEERDLGSALSRINRLLSQDLPSGKLVTFVAGILSQKDGRVKLLSAGHGPLLLYTASDDCMQSFPAHGIPFGVFPSMNYGPAQELTLAPGDILILITDGFFEWADKDDQQFGLDRLREAIRASRDLIPAKIIERLYQDVLHFSGGTEQQDDLTAVVIKRSA